MLINKNNIDKRNSKYQCDMCGVGLESKERNIIYVAEGYATMNKKWDLCPRCYKKLNKAIKNYKEKSKGEQKNDTKNYSLCMVRKRRKK